MAAPAGKVVLENCRLMGQVVPKNHRGLQVWWYVSECGVLGLSSGLGRTLLDYWEICRCRSVLGILYMLSASTGSDSGVVSYQTVQCRKSLHRWWCFACGQRMSWMEHLVRISSRPSSDGRKVTDLPMVKLRRLLDPLRVLWWLYVVVTCT